MHFVDVGFSVVGSGFVHDYFVLLDDHFSSSLHYYCFADCEVVDDYHFSDADYFYFADYSDDY